MLNNPPSRAHSANMNALTGTPRHVRPHHVAGLCERADERPDFALGYLERLYLVRPPDEASVTCFPSLKRGASALLTNEPRCGQFGSGLPDPFGL
jgi:hypothetical protein